MCAACWKIEIGHACRDKDRCPGSSEFRAGPAPVNAHALEHGLRVPRVRIFTIPL